jgi:DNA repair exonuclease SbcCD ATPase subunit
MDSEVQQKVIDILNNDTITVAEKRTRIRAVKGVTDSDMYAVNSAISYYEASDVAQRRVKAAQDSTQRIQEEIDASNRQADSVRGQIESLKRERDQRKKEYKDVPSSTLWNPANWGKSKSERLETSAQKKDAHAALDEAGARLDRAQARLAEEEKKLKQQQEESEKALKAAQDAKKDAQRKAKDGQNALLDQYEDIKNLEKEIANAKMSQKFSDLRSNISDSRVRIEAMNRVYDNALLGSYLASKMAALLASDEFCSAVSQCKDGRSMLNGEAPDLSNLFSGNPITRRSGKSGATQVVDELNDAAERAPKDQGESSGSHSGSDSGGAKGGSVDSSRK